MNKVSTRLAGILILGILLIITTQNAKAQDVEVSYQTFYDELSPYGQWMDDPDYGSVWLPNEQSGFRPYATNGHWAMTDQGNMWVSDAPYAWAAYHYGRWTYNSYYGWVWIPGNQWAPAWVTWRSGGGYYGWAPMGPGVDPGGYYDYPDNYWVFVGPSYLYQPDVYSYYQPGRVRRYIRQSTYINETYVDNGFHSTYYYGPRREAIERETNRPVQVFKVSGTGGARQANVSGGAVQVYRPTINAATRTSARPANVVRAPEPVGQPQRYSRSAGNRETIFRQEQQARAANPGRTIQTNRPQSQRVESQGGSFGQPSQRGQTQTQPRVFQSQGDRSGRFPQSSSGQPATQQSQPQRSQQQAPPRTQQQSSPKPQMTPQQSSKPAMRGENDKKGGR